MKKLLIGLMGMVFICGLAFSQTNFERVAQIETLKGNIVLQGIAEEISDFHVNMANDALISGKEMKTLKKMVSDFDRTRDKFNKELKFYEVRTSASIPEIIRQHLKIYFFSPEKQNPTFLNDYSDNKKQEIRHWFTEKTGYNIKVENARNYFGRGSLGFLLGLFGVLVVFLCIKQNIYDIICGLSVFAIVLGLFLFVF